MSYPQEVTKTIQEFKYFSPSTLDEAVSLFKELRGDTKILAGGTDLLPLMQHRKVTPEYVISLRNVMSLSYIKDEGGGLRIGALTKISAILDSDLIRRRFLSLYEAAKTFGTTQVRNMATIGGNICRSSPSADTVPPLISFDAEVKVIGPKGKRKILLEDFSVSPGENVLDQEILTEIIVPSVQLRCGTAFRKIMRTSVDLAKVNGAVRISITNGRCDDIRIVLGGVASRPIRARRAEDTIRGEKIDGEVIRKTAEEAVREISPITDVRSTAQYRAQVSKVLVTRLIELAIEQSDGE